MELVVRKFKDFGYHGSLDIKSYTILVSLSFFFLPHLPLNVIHKLFQFNLNSVLCRFNN